MGSCEVGGPRATLRPGRQRVEGRFGTFRQQPGAEGAQYNPIVLGISGDRYWVARSRVLYIGSTPLFFRVNCSASLVRDLVCAVIPEGVRGIGARVGADVF
jgi:hypothetical protein